MEEKNIVFTGLSRAISDLDCHDGDLSISHNIIQENGSMQPIWMPESKITLQDGETLLYIHETARYKNYIIHLSDQLLYFTEDNAERKPILSINDPLDFLKIAHLGNTLVLSTKNGIRYAVFQNGTYNDIGEKPEIDISWGLVGSVVGDKEEEHEEYKIKVNRLGAIVDDNENEISDAVFAMINKTVNDYRHSFVYPFFICAAYKMFDGTYSYVSSPVLLIPDNKGVRAYLRDVKTEAEDGTGFFFYTGNLHTEMLTSVICYDILSVGKLPEWSDLIQSVDVFVTLPQAPYDMTKLPTGIHGDLNSFGIYGDTNLTGFRERQYTNTSNYYFILQQYSEQEYISNLLESSQFYKIHSWAIDEFIKINDQSAPGVYKKLELPETFDTLNIATNEYLNVAKSYREYDKIVAERLYVYNQRIHALGVQRLLYDGFKAENMWVHTDNGSSEVSYDIYVSIDNGDGSVTNLLRESDYKGMSLANRFFYYPNSNATRMVVVDSNGNSVLDIPLRKHPVLNGAYYLWLTNSSEINGSKGSIEKSIDRTVNEWNKMYVSDVNNPMYFPLDGIFSVGTGRIISAASITKAISQGQFGQFPLYIFSSDGVWAMEVGTNGLYTKTSPISRDVCINGNSVVQTDNTVLFVTEKGVMGIDGGSIVCISEVMDGRSFDTSEVDGLCLVLSKEGISSSLNNKSNFVEYAKLSKIAYDYSNNRIILFNSQESYCYVYSLSSGTWATSELNITNTITDYPDTYIQSGNKVRILSDRIDYDSQKFVKTLLVTRPIKMDDDSYKTIYEVVVRGAYDRNEGAVLLWGSHDGITYSFITDSLGNRIYRTGGTAYRYYRIGVVGNMKVGEKIKLCSVRFRKKYQNRLR